MRLSSSRASRHLLKPLDILTATRIRHLRARIKALLIIIQGVVVTISQRRPTLSSINVNRAGDTVPRAWRQSGKPGDSPDTDLRPPIA